MAEKVFDINQKIVDSFIQGIRPPEHMRNQLDIGFKYERKTFEIFEIRPIYTRENEFQEISCAKFKLDEKQKAWKLYWQRASGKWMLYEGLPAADTIHEVLEHIKKDPHGCFWG